jgi:hypothetical protein
VLFVHSSTDNAAIQMEPRRSDERQERSGRNLVKSFTFLGWGEGFAAVVMWWLNTSDRGPLLGRGAARHHPGPPWRVRARSSAPFRTWPTAGLKSFFRKPP